MTYRIVLKIGSSSLTREDGHLDLNRIDQVAESVAGAISSGTQVVLVSSGAIAAALWPLKMAYRPQELALAQATAAVGQGLLMAQWTAAFSRYGLLTGQVLLSAAGVVRRSQYANAKRSIEKLLEMGVVPVINENDAVATDEIRFGDNDRLAAIVCHLISADKLLLATDVDGLYTAPPEDAQARLISEVCSTHDLGGLQLSLQPSRLGTGGMVTKVAAAELAAANGTLAVLFNADSIPQALAGKPVGTIFHITGPRRGIRRLWLAYIAHSAGVLVLDEGAAAAITEGKKSLLAAGINKVQGIFSAGDIVELQDESGNVLARGLSTYSSTEVSELIEMIGSDEQGVSERTRPVVHRDHLAQTRY